MFHAGWMVAAKAIGLPLLAEAHLSQVADEVAVYCHVQLLFPWYS